MRRRFAAIYLLNRAVSPANTGTLIINKKRSDVYLEALAGLFRSVTDATVTVGTDYRITIGKAVLSDLDVPKKWNGEVS